MGRIRIVCLDAWEVLGLLASSTCRVAADSNCSPAQRSKDDSAVVRKLYLPRVWDRPRTPSKNP